MERRWLTPNLRLLAHSLGQSHPSPACEESKRWTLYPLFDLPFCEGTCGDWPVAVIGKATQLELKQMANIRTKKFESTTQEHTRSMCKIGNWKFFIAHITDAIYRMQMNATLVERTTFRQRKTSAEGSFGFGRIEALLRKRCKAQAFHGLPLTLGSARGTSVSRLKWTHWGRHVAPGT